MNFLEGKSDHIIPSTKPFNGYPFYEVKIQVPCHGLQGPITDWPLHLFP